MAEARKEFAADGKLTLVCRGLDGKVQIAKGDSGAIIVEIAGDGDSVSAVEMTQNESQIEIHGDRASEATSTVTSGSGDVVQAAYGPGTVQVAGLHDSVVNVSGGGGRSVSVNPSGVFVDGARVSETESGEPGADAPTDLSTKIIVPEGTDIVIGDCAGVEIDEVNGRINLNVARQDSASVQGFNGGSVQLSDRATFTGAEGHGSVTMKLTGCSKAEASGDFVTVNVRATDMSRVQLEGGIDDLAATALDMAKVRAQGRIRQQVTHSEGMARVYVTNTGVSSGIVKL